MPLTKVYYFFLLKWVFVDLYLFLYSNCEVLTTLTPDSGRILSKLHAVQPKGKICFCTGIRVAHVSIWMCFVRENECKKKNKLKNGVLKPLQVDRCLANKYHRTV